jgi:glycosidase
MLVRLFGNTKPFKIPYGTIEENGVGKFDDINIKALKSIRDLGVTHCWFTGVIEQATVSDFSKYGIPADDPHIVKGRAGSPYAIRDYYDVSTELANDVSNRMEEFESLIDRTHDCGLKVIIDFIPNHVARSYFSDMSPKESKNFGDNDQQNILFKPENNFLYITDQIFVPPHDYIPLGGNPLPENYKVHIEKPARVTGNDVYTHEPSLNDWFETIKLNFGIDPIPPHQHHFDPVPTTWLQLLDILLYWTRKGVDGFRCDMAEMVPAEFWNWVIPCVKTRFPDTLFIGEIYKPELYEQYIQQGYFDYLYDKVRLYDTLVGLLKGNASADELTKCAESVQQFPERMLSFLENHDEERLLGNGIRATFQSVIPAMTVCATISKGPILIYAGQETGERGDENAGFSNHTNRTSVFDYTSMPEHQKWMNNHSYDGGKMSEEQIEYRNFYKKLLTICRNHEAIKFGKYYDLQFCNRFYQSEGYDEQFIYSFIRYTDDESLLIVVNFNAKQAYNLNIKIPEDALTKMKLRINGSFSFTNLLRDEAALKIECSKLMNTANRFGGLKLKLQPSQASIFDIKQLL